MSAVQRSAAFVVAVLVLAIVAVIALSGFDGPIGRRPDLTPTASPSASPPSPAATASPTPPASPSASPSASADEDVIETLAEIEEQVIAIRGLPAAEIGPPEILTRDEVAAELEELFESEYPPEDRERDNFVLRAFGLLGPDEDIGELQLELLTDQVAGFYDSDERRMVVVSDAGLDAEARLTYAHEYTHALQDAAFGLDSLETDAVGEDDRGLARVSLIEGDATVTMLAWALRHLSQQELMEIGAGPVPDTSGIPTWMVNQLMFPYIAGQSWVLEIMAVDGGDPLSPEYGPVDAAFEDPPDSTAQIIDVQKWFDRVGPTSVDVAGLAGALGDGWEEVDASPVGQASTGILLEHFGVSGPEAQDAAEGWAGDSAMVARGPDGAFAVAWRSVWETEEDAAEFASAYDAVVDGADFPVAVSHDGDTVLVVHASDADLLGRVVEAAGQ